VAVFIGVGARADDGVVGRGEEGLGCCFCRHLSERSEGMRCHQLYGVFSEYEVAVFVREEQCACDVSDSHGNSQASRSLRHCSKDTGLSQCGIISVFNCAILKLNVISDAVLLCDDSSAQRMGCVGVLDQHVGFDGNLSSLRCRGAMVGSRAGQPRRGSRLPRQWQSGLTICSTDQRQGVVNPCPLRQRNTLP
jgi:hypothetical protein